MPVKFTIKLILFMAILYIASMAVCRYLKVRALNDMGNKVFWVMQKRDQAYDIAVMGPSSVYNGVDPVLMNAQCGKSFVNLSFHGLSAMEQYIITAHFLKYNKIKTLVLYMHPPVLHSAETFNKPSNIYTLLPYLDEEPLINDLLARDHEWAKQLVWKYLPISIYLEFNSQYFFSPEPTVSRYDTTLGFSGKAYDYDSTSLLRYFQYMENEGVVSSDSGKYRFTVDKSMLTWYDRFNDLAKEHHVKLLLFEQPIKSRYYGYADFEQNRAIIKQWAKQRDIEYLDFSDLPGFDNEPYYYDDLHFNVKGAQKFSKLLADTLCKK